MLWNMLHMPRIAKVFVPIQSNDFKVTFYCLATLSIFLYVFLSTCSFVYVRKKISKKDLLQPHLQSPPRPSILAPRCVAGPLSRVLPFTSPQPLHLHDLMEFLFAGGGCKALSGSTIDIVYLCIYCLIPQPACCWGCVGSSRNCIRGNVPFVFPCVALLSSAGNLSRHDFAFVSSLAPCQPFLSPHYYFLCCSLLSFVST